MVSCIFKIGPQKDMCIKKIGLCGQNPLIILGSVVNIIRGTYVAFYMTRCMWTLTFQKL